MWIKLTTHKHQVSNTSKNSILSLETEKTYFYRHFNLEKINRFILVPVYFPILEGIWTYPLTRRGVNIQAVFCCSTTKMAESNGFPWDFHHKKRHFLSFWGNTDGADSSVAWSELYKQQNLWLQYNLEMCRTDSRLYVELLRNIYKIDSHTLQLKE